MKSQKEFITLYAEKELTTTLLPPSPQGQGRGADNITYNEKYSSRIGRNPLGRFP